MGVIWAKFRKEKSTQEVLEALQEKIETLETFTVNTQEQKKRIVSNFLSVSIGVYVIAFVAFYFIYFPPTWQERVLYFIPLLLFPIIIILFRRLFTWYFQRKLNKNSKQLTALRGEKKKILEQVMDKETYKVAVNLLARFADKPSKTTIATTLATTPSKYNQPILNRSLPSTLKSQRLVSTSTPTTRSDLVSSTTPVMVATSGMNQQLRRRTPFPIVNQKDKGVFDRMVDILIGDGPQDRFAMICKECYSHNGMALKEDFEYTTFRCAFCSALNPARKSRPVAPRLSVMPVAAVPQGDSSDTSDSEDDKDDSDNEQAMNVKTLQFTASNNNTVVKNETQTAAAFPSSSNMNEEILETKLQPQNEELNEEAAAELPVNSDFTELLKKLEKSDSAIGDVSMSPVE